MDPLYASLAVVSLSVVYVLYKRYGRISISDIPGPKSSSFWLGNIPELTLTEFGEIESKWQAQYGNVVRIKASLGEERLWIADPAALKHVLQTGGYSYPKPPGIGTMDSFFIDRGIVLVEGDTHRRHRRVMLPAFGTNEVREFVPMFQQIVKKTKDQWNSALSTEKSGKVLDIPVWLSKATLDSIGRAAFDHDFGAVDNVKDSLSDAYNNIMTDVWGRPNDAKIFLRNVVNFIPDWIITNMCEIMPERSFKRMRANRIVVHKAAHALLETKREQMAEQKGADDLLSLLVKANLSKNEEKRLDSNEIIAEMRTVLLAGHETTATSLTWTLYELAKQPEVQRRLRQEIWDTQAKAHARGDADLIGTDYENMAYLNAVINESLRFHSVAVGMERMVGKDDVLPLFTPLTTKSGKVINSIPVPKGLHLMLSVAGYNTIKEVWGEDAADFSPERWLKPRLASPTLGVGVGNLLTFSAGVRSCIGWRFALMEMQTFLTALIADYEYTLPANPPKVRRERALFMVPTVDGEIHCPLNVTPARR